MDDSRTSKDNKKNPERYGEQGMRNPGNQWCHYTVAEPYVWRVTQWYTANSTRQRQEMLHSAGFASKDMTSACLGWINFVSRKERSAVLRERALRFSCPQSVLVHLYLQVLLQVRYQYFGITWKLCSMHSLLYLYVSCFGNSSNLVSAAPLGQRSPLWLAFLSSAFDDSRNTRLWIKLHSELFLPIVVMSIDVLTSCDRMAEWTSYCLILSCLIWTRTSACTGFWII